MYKKFIEKLREKEREPFFLIPANYPIELSEKMSIMILVQKKKKKRKEKKGFPKISNLA